MNSIEEGYYWDRSAKLGAVTYDVPYKALGDTEKGLSYLTFVDTLPSLYLDTEFTQCARLKSKLTALEAQLDNMPDGPNKDYLLTRIASGLRYVEFKKERIIELKIENRDEDYDQQLEMIRLHFKKSKAEFESFVKELQDSQNHLKNEAYWDKLLEILGEYGSCYDHSYADVISDAELLELVFSNRNDDFSPEFENQLRESLKKDSSFDDSYINQKIEKLKENPVQISVNPDNKALMQEGIGGRHILIYHLDGKDVRFSLQRDRMSNGFTVSSMDDPYCDSDSRFLRLYAEQHMVSCGISPEGSNVKSFTGLLKDNTSREESSAIAAETA